MAEKTFENKFTVCGLQNNLCYYMGDAEDIKTWRQFWGEF